MNDKLVVGLAGMPGSGKSVVVNVAKTYGYGVVVMGDIVRNEARKRGLQPNPENHGKIMLELRQKEGNSVIANRCVSRIKDAKEHKVIVDGIRSLGEVEEFRKHFSRLALIAVHSSPETRFKRLYHRQRSDDPKNFEIFHERDMRELSVGLGNAIAMAERIVINEERIEKVKEKAKYALRNVEQRWTK